MSFELDISKLIFLCGYVLEQSPTALQESKQPRKISDFCQQNAYNLIFTEQEAGAAKMICRPGLWRVTRALICYECDPGDMPVSFDVEAWMQHALTTCRCSQPTGVHGIVLSSIKSLSTDAVSGSRYALALAIARKHLFAVDEGKCVSCCNPAAAPFMKKYV